MSFTSKLRTFKRKQNGDPVAEMEKYLANDMAKNIADLRNAVQTINTDIAANAAELSAPANYAVSGLVDGDGAFLTTSTSYVAVDELSVSLTTTGRPVLVGLFAIYDSDYAFPSRIAVDDATAGEAWISILRGSTTVMVSALDYNIAGSAVSNTLAIPGGFFTIDLEATVGTHTYIVRTKSAISSTIRIEGFKLLAIEL